MAGGFDEKAGGGGAQMGVMQGPMVSKSRDIFFHLLIIYLLYFIHISISWRNRKDFFFPFRKPQMSLEIPGTTSQVLEGSMTVVVSCV